MKNNWTRVITIAAVFFVAACSQTTSSDSPEGAGKVGIFSYSPREIPTDGEKLLSIALAIRGNNTPSLSEVRRMEREMINKIPEGERGDFELALTDIKKILALCEINYFEGNFEGSMIDNLRFSYEGSVPENGMPLIRASKEREGKLFYADIIPGIRKDGCFFTESDRARFGRYLGW